MRCARSEFILLAHSWCAQAKLRTAMRSVKRNMVNRAGKRRRRLLRDPQVFFRSLLRDFSVAGLLDVCYGLQAGYLNKNANMMMHDGTAELMFDSTIVIINLMNDNTKQINEKQCFKKFN